MSNFIKECEQCGEDFKKPWYDSRKKFLNRKYCSIECSTNSKKKQIEFECDYCNWISSDRLSHFNRKKKHFCSRQCYADYAKEIMTKEDHNNYWNRMSDEQIAIRKKARRKLNYEVFVWRIIREDCNNCWNTPAEAHHEDYGKPLDVIWLCKICHEKEHRENPELLE